jgi:NADH-quinone oxidoreductase subunit G
VLGNLLGLPGFDYESSEEVRAEVLAEGFAARLSNRMSTKPVLTKPTVSSVDSSAVERLTDVPVYFSDAIVRRAASLQATRDARAPRAIVNPRTAQAFGVAGGDKVRARQGEASALLELAIDERLADGTVRIAAAHASTASLGAMFGPITVERA